MAAAMEKMYIAGVTGAGGAGFPTHVKLSAKADTVLANGLECEPLLRVDQQIMEQKAAQVVEGMGIAMAETGAKQGIICLKEKYKQAAQNLQAAIKSSGLDIALKQIGSYYPAGDEQALVYEATGKIVPTGGLPLDAGAVVLNVSTLVQISEAVKDRPVTHRYVTVTGAVKRPLTIQAPIGTAVRELIACAGWAGEPDEYAMILGGPAMGTVSRDWDSPLTKTLGGIILLPKAHSLIQKKTAPLESQIRLSRSVCCQCNQCTQLCPRNMLGLDTAPHKAMRALAYGDGSGLKPEEVLSCSQCGVCTYFACNMGLMPSRIMGKLKEGILGEKRPFEKKPSKGVSRERAFMNLPADRLIGRLGLREYDLPAPMEREPLAVERVKIPLKQHIGAACTPCVEEGQMVSAGDCVGKVPDGQLGVPVHTGIAGKVHAVTRNYVEIHGKGGKT